MGQTVLQNNSKIVLPTSSAQRNHRGFSLIEMMIALVILSVSILGMTSLSLTMMRSNNETEMRNAAVRLTSEVAEDLGALTIEDVVDGTSTREVSIRGKNIPFTVILDVESLTNDVSQVDITVSYIIKGITKTNSAVVYKHRAS